MKKKNYLVAGKTHSENYSVTVGATPLVKYSSKGFRYLSLCNHSVAIAEKEEIFQIHKRKLNNSISCV